MQLRAIFKRAEKGLPWAVRFSVFYEQMNLALNALLNVIDDEVICSFRYTLRIYVFDLVEQVILEIKGIPKW